MIDRDVHDIVPTSGRNTSPTPHRRDGPPPSWADPHGSASTLTSQQTDRAAGVLIGAACGDALGVPYEFAPPLPAGEQPRMLGGGLGPYAPGEYSDDTQMAVCIAQVAATGVDLRTTEALDAVAESFLTWIREGASDVGAQTRTVLSTPDRTKGQRSGQALCSVATELHRRTGRTAGNGSLMRTGVVALAYLHDPQAMAQAARAVSELTHHDPLAGDACVLWCAGIRRAVLDDTLAGVREGLALLPEQRRGQWAGWLDEAESNPPGHFVPNGFVVTALQAAWSAITRTPIPHSRPAEGSFTCQHLQRALAAAVRAGNDTDTVAAIAGALLGARWGASAVPMVWQRAVHGWPGMRAADLVRLAVLTARRGYPDPSGWPELEHHPVEPDIEPFTVAHPQDDGVMLGNLSLATAAGLDVDAVVSLCRIGRGDFAGCGTGSDRVQVWLVDRPGENAHPHFVVDQAARAVAELRAEGRRVLLHCAAGRSRTPAVAARYTTLAFGIPPGEALQEMQTTLEPSGYRINPELRLVVYELAGEPAPPVDDSHDEAGQTGLW